MNKDEELIRLKEENEYLKNEIIKISRYKLRYILCGMRDRCYRKSHFAYKDYGARGISICDEWMGKGGFEHFYDWSFKNGWNPLLTIDRIDPNGDYCPQNCRWVNWKEQQNNRRNSRYVEFGGEIHTVAEWERILGWKSNTIYSRLDRGWSIERALTEAPRRRNKMPH